MNTSGVTQPGAQISPLILILLVLLLTGGLNI